MQDILTISNKSPIDLVKKFNSPILLQVEYSSFNQFKLTQSYGFELVRKLRTELNCKQPIILYSPLPKKYFILKEKVEHLKYAALNDPSVSFIQQPINKNLFLKTLSNLEALSDAGLADVNEMLYKRSGRIIDKINHDIKFKVELYHIEKYLNEYLTAYERKEANLDYYFSNLKKLKDESNEHDFVRFKMLLVETCSKLLGRGEKSRNVKNEIKPEIKYNVVLLEDDEDYMSLLKKRLSSFFNVKSYSESKNAINLLKRDVKNEILAVISDWRLFEKGSNKWQIKQGYDVLEFSGTNGIRSHYALTSLNDRNVHQVRNKLNVSFDLIKKDYLITDDDWNNLIEKLKIDCDLKFNIIGSIPKTPLWLKHYFEKYRSNRSNVEWLNFESTISKEANRIFEKVLSITPSETHYYQEEGFTLPDDDSPKSSFKLKPILILRRVTMAYWFHSLLNSRRYNINPKTELRNFVAKKFIGQAASNNLVGKYFKQLCIRTKTFQKDGILPEEKSWLIHHDLM